MKKHIKMNTPWDKFKARPRFTIIYDKADEEFTAEIHYLIHKYGYKRDNIYQEDGLVVETFVNKEPLGDMYARQ